MDFTLTPDQTALTGALDRLASQFESKPIDFHGFALTGARLEQELVEGQYFDIAGIPDLGPLTAAVAVERLAWLPCTAEIALSMLVLPHLPGDWPRPLALVEKPSGPPHHLRVAIVGAGPAGLYAADELLKQPGVTVDVYDRLLTPHGLVRAGVAPDHPHTKLM